ncbi:ImmA/IrrE family metallo-endopeptidase [Dokdonella sp.]|uniref:ImmA/IrrE family metallo-endopeptidase n=1 Tax=Dokdonella sp. TaxID=2291710 RepID=UPI0031BDDFAF|nr:hypothetical protein [Dokdonella sp.]
MNFSIAWQWLSSIHEPAEVRETGANLKMRLGHDTLTRNVDDWSGTVRDEARLSAYPLALWLAANWWRLRWESLPSRQPDLAWRMSHEMVAAGFGYVWPQIVMASDGESIQLWAAATGEEATSPIRYLTSTHGTIPADEFERVLDDFFVGTIARLDARNVADTALHGLLKELSEERSDPELARYRRLEAIAGFDAGEGPADLLDELEGLVAQAGIDATQEIAAIQTGTEPTAAIAAANRMAAQHGVQAKPLDAIRQAAQSVSVATPAWLRGRELANKLRESLQLDGQPITDQQLHEIMGVSTAQLAMLPEAERTPLSLAIRSANEVLTLHLRKRRPDSQRFELARLLADQALASESDRWLPSTDAKTSRQKTQRAFAAEFLCPFDSLKHYLGDDLSEDAMDDAAHHFDVSSLAVRAQLVNHGALPREQLADTVLFPYPVT